MYLNLVWDNFDTIKELLDAYQTFGGKQDSVTSISEKQLTGYFKALQTIIDNPLRNKVLEDMFKGEKQRGKIFEAMEKGIVEYQKSPTWLAKGTGWMLDQVGDVLVVASKSVGQKTADAVVAGLRPYVQGFLELAFQEPGRYIFYQDGS